jgi:hypothetical protein
MASNNSNLSGSVEWKNKDSDPTPQVIYACIEIGFLLRFLVSDLKSGLVIEARKHDLNASIEEWDDCFEKYLQWHDSWGYREKRYRSDKRLHDEEEWFSLDDWRHTYGSASMLIHHVIDIFAELKRILPSIETSQITQADLDIIQNRLENWERGLRSFIQRK